MIPWFAGDAESLLVRGLLVTLAVWVGLSAYVIVNRLRFDRSSGRLAELERHLSFDAVALDPGSAAVQRILGRLSRRTVYGLMADAELPRPMLDLFAAYSLQRWGLPRLLRDAAAHRGRRPWHRISALFALGALRVDGVHYLLRDALFSKDPDVASAAVVILSRMEDHRAASILVDGLAANAFSPSRIATQLDQFAVPIDDLLMPLLEDPQPSVRYWGVSLLARYPDAGHNGKVAALADDESAPLRKAVLQTLAATRAEQAGPIARRSLGDPAPFVRSTAIRALRTLGLATDALGDRDDIARAIVPLLADKEWEVRLSAKEALVALGPSIWRAVSSALDASDRFARNGAAEVLQNLGLLDQLIDEVGRGVEPSAEVVSVIERAFREGGTGMIDAAVKRSNPTFFPSIASLLSQLTFVGVRVSP